MAAASLRNRSISVARLLVSRPAQISQTRSLASDALVEIKPGEIGIVSGIPEEHLKRGVIIYSPARSASQQGAGKVGKWKINFMSTQKWENPLMGWTSTGDPYANVGDAGLAFDSEEAAKAFAEKHGWHYLEFAVNNKVMVMSHPEAARKLHAWRKDFDKTLKRIAFFAYELDSPWDPGINFIFDKDDVPRSTLCTLIELLSSTADPSWKSALLPPPWSRRDIPMLLSRPPPWPD